MFRFAEEGVMKNIRRIIMARNTVCSVAVRKYKYFVRPGSEGDDRRYFRGELSCEDGEDFKSFPVS